MEFVLVLALAGAVALLGWWRSGQSLARWVFLGVIRFYVQFWHRWWAPRASTLPATGPVLLISNHTSSSDPTFLQTACNTRILGWLSSHEHYDIHPLVRKLQNALYCVPVQRTGQDATALRLALRRLREGRALAIFPEGNLSGVAKGRLRTPKGGAAWLALRSGAAVVPAYIAGGPQTHNLLRAWLWPSPRPVRVYLGPPIDLAAFRDRPITRRLVEEVARYLMDQVVALAPKSAQRRSTP
jgi:1-acyl-sn-glycerol-3-phosphate acyltransferase